jgi:hypothetical protein
MTLQAFLTAIAASGAACYAVHKLAPGLKKGKKSSPGPLKNSAFVFIKAGLPLAFFSAPHSCSASQFSQACCWMCVCVRARALNKRWACIRPVCFRSLSHTSQSDSTSAFQKRQLRLRHTPAAAIAISQKKSTPTALLLIVASLPTLRRMRTPPRRARW